MSDPRVYSPLTNKPHLAISLPPELLGGIFEFACAAIRKGRSRLAGGRYQGIDRIVRRSICSTCHRWRSVAFCTASLWCRIPIRVDRESLLSFPLPVVEQEIERAAGLPIILNVVVRGGGGPWKELQSLLCGTLSRCRSIALTWDKDNLDVSILLAPNRNYSPIHLPHLQTLWLSRNPRSSPSAPHSQGTDACLDLTVAPRLQELLLHNFSHPIRLELGNSLTQLLLFLTTSIDIDISLLQQCRQLRELAWTFELDHISTSQLVELAKVELSHLHHLTFDVSTSTREAVLWGLSALHLRSMRLRYGFVPSHNQFASLESLCISVVEGDTNALAIFHAVPSVLRLNLAFALNSTPDYLEALLEHDEYGGFAVLPRLRDLTVDIKPASVEWADAVIHSRNNGQLEGPFLLHLPLGVGLWERNVGLEDLRSRHPQSIDDRVIEDPFHLDRGSTWSILDC